MITPLKAKIAICNKPMIFNQLKNILSTFSKYITLAKNGLGRDSFEKIKYYLVQDLVT